MTEHQPITATDAGPQARKSKGETLFDWVVYGGINYLGTFALTVVVADLLQTSSWGRALCDWGKRGLMKAKLSEGKANAAVTTSILFPGGSLMLWPVYALEKHRTGIVSWLNEKFGDTTDRTAIARDVPQQTWGSLIKGRIVAWGVVFLTLVGAQSALGGERFDRFSNGVAHGTAKLFGVPETLRNEGSWVYRYGKLGAIDALATAASVVLLYTSSKFFAQRREEKREYREHHSLPVQHQAFADHAPMETAPMASGETPLAAIAGNRQHEGAVHTHAAISAAPAV